jgi:hypothetical protein
MLKLGLFVGTRCKQVKCHLTSGNFDDQSGKSLALSWNIVIFLMFKGDYIQMGFMDWHSDLVRVLSTLQTNSAVVLLFFFDLEWRARFRLS